MPEFDIGGLEFLGFFGFAIALIIADIVKTRREIARDKKAADR